MKKLLIATKNKGKVIEIKEFLKDMPLELLSLEDLGVDEDVEEDGDTYEENSRKKALFYAGMTGLPVISDDGGLEISALNGEPGVHSRRWLGHTATDDELMEHLRKVAESLPDGNREAFFKVVLTLGFPEGKVFSVKGEVKGLISKSRFPKYLSGYPFRSYFFLPEIQKYYFETELTEEEMKKYNHRFLAIQKIKPFIERELLGLGV